jgi:hypothetical protein
VASRTEVATVNRNRVNDTRTSASDNAGIRVANRREPAAQDRHDAHVECPGAGVIAWLAAHPECLEVDSANGHRFNRAITNRTDSRTDSLDAAMELPSRISIECFLDLLAALADPIPAPPFAITVNK